MVYFIELDVEQHPEASAVTRSQNLVYVLPRDTASMSQVLAPALERIDEEVAAVQVLVLASSADAALALSRAAGRLTAGRPIAALPATSVSRAARLLRARPAHVLAATPAVVLSLLEGAAIKLDTVRTIVLAWVDETLAAGATHPFEAVMGELPKDAARILITARLSEEVEGLIERYLRRARRITAPPTEDAAPLDLRYLSVAEPSRASALRRLLDAVDPERAAIFVRSDEGEREVRDAIAQLGYAADEQGVQVTRGEAVDAPLLILYEIPATRHEIAPLVEKSSPAVIVLAPPRQIPALRTLAAGGTIAPYTLPEATTQARSAEESVRAELRAALADGAPARELLALEPLLEEFDGVELAAAALRLLERERDASRAERRRETPAGERGAPSGDWTRIFVNVGARDHARPGDLMGAVTGESGIGREQVGKIELRDTHSLIDIAAPVAQRVVTSLTGSTIRGRRVIARVDAGREGRAEGRGDKRPFERSGGARGAGPRGGARGRPAGRSDGGERRPDRQAPRRRNDRPERPPRRSAD